MRHTSMEKEDQGAKKHTWKMNVTLYSHLVPTKGDKRHSVSCLGY